MSRNLIYIVAIDDLRSKVTNSNYSQFSIASWEYWCKRNDVDLQVITESAFNRPIWNKSLIYHYGLRGYDLVGVVDSDTIIHPEAPNIFKTLDPDKFYGVNDLCDLNWLFSSIQDRQKFFPEIQLDIMKYINAGVLFFGTKYLDVFRTFLDFVLQNEQDIERLNGGGKEQTLLNFHLQKNKVDIELLTPAWNLLSIHKKNMFQYNWQLNTDKTPYFLKYAYLYHFTGFPIEDRTRIMHQTFDFLYGS